MEKEIGVGLMLLFFGILYYKVLSWKYDNKSNKNNSYYRDQDGWN